jgi:hypothetical protein
MPNTLTPDERQTRDLVCRELTLRHESIDEASRSFEAVVATETPAAVFDFRSWEIIDEILVAKGGTFPESVVLLDDHDRSRGIGSVIGSARQFRRSGDRWVGRGYVGDAVEGNLEREQIWRDLVGGHIRAVSIGYRVLDFVDLPPGSSQTINGRRYEAGERTLRVSTRWAVHELSLTPIGADSEAVIRSRTGRGDRPKKRKVFFR